MRSMSMLQLVGGVAAAGVVAAGTTAFTAAGLTSTATPFLGGVVTQSINGGTVDGVTFGFSDGARTIVNQVALHFADTNTDGATVTVTTTVSGGTNPTWTCSGTVTSKAITCTTSGYQLTAANNITGLSISAS